MRFGRDGAKAAALGVVALLAAAPAAAGALPDGRALELITPGADKGGGDVSARHMQVAPDGERIAFTANNVIGEDATHGMGAFGSSIPYVAERTPSGWRSSFRSRLPVPAFVTQNDFEPFWVRGSEDLSTIVLDAVYGESTGLQTGVWLDGEGDAAQLAVPQLPGSPHQPRALAGSADGSTLVVWLGRFNQLETPPPTSPTLTGGTIAEYRDGQVRNVNVDDDGNFLHATGALFAGRDGINLNSSNSGSTTRNPVSADGSRIFFTSRVPGSANDSPYQLYVRIDGERTIQLSASTHSGDPQPPPAAVQFAGATRDGSTAYFTTVAQLTDDATGAGPFLYSYDLPSGPGTGTLSLVAGVAHPVAVGAGTHPIPQVLVADDGDRVYYRSDDDGGSIYRYDSSDGSTTPVATQTGAVRLQESLSQESPGLASDASPDGGHLVFVTTADLLPEDVYAGRQLYRYDAAEDELMLVSRGPSAPASFDVDLVSPVEWKEQAFHDYNFVSDDGDHVFFETNAGLVAEDDNGVADAYGWHDGEVSVLSGGDGTYPSTLAGASRDGSSAFFFTENDLLPQDGDDGIDAYVARIGGGFPLPPTPVPCIDDACQGPPASAPPVGPVDSGPRDGDGNVTGPRPKPPAIAVRRLATRGATARLRVVTPAAGTVAVSGAGVRKASRKVARRGPVRVAVGLTAKSRKRLARRGKLTLRVHVAFTSRSQTYSQRVLRVTFKTTGGRR